MDSIFNAYHLQLSDILLPPDTLLILWPDIRHQVVGVHENMDKTIHGSQHRYMGT
jgi:hypothetical protein